MLGKRLQTVRLGLYYTSCCYKLASMVFFISSLILDLAFKQTLLKGLGRILCLKRCADHTPKTYSREPPRYICQVFDASFALKKTNEKLSLNTSRWRSIWWHSFDILNGNHFFSNTARAGHLIRPLCLSKALRNSRCHLIRCYHFNI